MRRPSRRHVVGGAIGVAMLAIPLLHGAFTNNIVMGPTAIGEKTVPVTPDGLKPAQCTSTIAALKTGSGVFAAPTNVNTLLLGTAGNDTITGLGGDDCLAGGAGTDILDGGPGNDVCIGNGVTTSFVNCEVTYP